MARKVQLIDKYDGGLNESASSAKIENNQVAEAVDVQFAKHGTIQTLGETKFLSDSTVYATPVNGPVITQRGLHHFNNTISLGSTDASIGSYIHTHGADAGRSMAVFSIFYINQISDVMAQFAYDYEAHVFTFATSGGPSGAQSLGAVEIRKDITDSDADYYDDLGVIARTDLGGSPGVRNLHEFYKKVATACNAIGGNPITATASPSGVIYEGEPGINWEDNTINVTFENDAPQEQPHFFCVLNANLTTEILGYITFPSDYEAKYSNSMIETTTLATYTQNDSYYNPWPPDSNPAPTAFPTGHVVFNGYTASPTKHVVKIAVVKSDASAKTFNVDIGIIEGSTISTQTVTTTSSSSSADIVTDAIVTAINANGPIGVADNISSDGSTENTDFATNVGALITLTTDLAGLGGVFSCDAYLLSDALNYTDNEIVAHLDGNRYLRFYVVGIGMVSSNIILGSTSDLAVVWADANPLPSFYDEGGRLRIFDTDFSHTNNNNKLIEVINRTGLFYGYGAADGTLDITTWIMSDQDVAWAFTDTNSGGVDVNGKGIRQRADTGASGPNDKEMRITIETTGAGTWGSTGAKNYKFFASAYNYDGSETLPDLTLTFNSGGLETLSLNEQELRLTVYCDPGANSSEADYIAKFSTQGFNIYWSSEDDGYGVKNLLCSIDFKNGLIREDGGKTVPWAQATSNQVKIYDGSSTNVDFPDPVEISTFESRNLYGWNDNTVTAKYKTATVAGRRTFIGNIFVDGQQYNDAILYSPFDQFDVFPYPDNILEISSTDGSSITALENTGDRLWEFKTNILYVHNISSGDPSQFFVEKSIPFYGCEGESKIVKTKDGLFWANSNSAFFFKDDIENIRDLRYYKEDDKDIERITESTWNGTFYKSTTVVGYDGKSDTVIMKDAANDNNGKVYVYSISNDNWTTGSEKASAANKETTNYVTMNDGSLVQLVEQDYSSQTNDLNIKTVANTGTGS